MRRHGDEHTRSHAGIKLALQRIFTLGCWAENPAQNKRSDFRASLGIQGTGAQLQTLVEILVQLITDFCGFTPICWP
jgi:hypothetical protein